MRKYLWLDLCQEVLARRFFYCGTGDISSTSWFVANETILSAHFQKPMVILFVFIQDDRATCFVPKDVMWTLKWCTLSPSLLDDCAAAFEDSPIFCGPVWMSGIVRRASRRRRLRAPRPRRNPSVRDGIACRLRLSLQNGSSLPLS